MSDLIITQILDIGQCICCHIINKDDMLIILQCSHHLHRKCLANIIVDSLDEFIDIYTINKKHIIGLNDLVDDATTTMCLNEGLESNIIKCPLDNIKYSITCSIFRLFKIPKIITKIIMFFEDNKIYTHHICTNIDFFHYLDKTNQKELFENIDYETESKMITNEHINDSIAKTLLYSDDFECHAVIFTKNNKYSIEIFPVSKCPVCNNSSDLDGTLQHATVCQYYDFVYSN